MGVAKMHVSARREPIAFWGNSRISPLCHFWRLSTVTRTKIRSAIFARNVVDANETSRPLPAIRSVRSFLFPKSNENRPFSNSEVCSGLLLRGMIFLCVAFFVVVVVLDVSTISGISKRAICLKKNNHLVARRNDVRPSDATHRERSHRVVPVLLRERRVLLRGDWRTRRLWNHVIAIGR